MIPLLPHRPTGTRRPSWTSSACRQRATGTCRSRSAARPSISSSAIPHRRCSTVPRIDNGTRNFDEIRFWADYITPGNTSSYIYDDAGGIGGLQPGERFVIAGDQNSDPLDGDSIPGSIQQLIEHPLVNTKVTPRSDGAVEAAALQGGANATHESDPQFDTADFADSAPGKPAGRLRLAAQEPADHRLRRVLAKAG